MKIILLIGMIISVLSFSSCPERCDYFTKQKNGKELECSSCCYFFFPFLCQVGCQEQKTAEEHFYSGVEKANSGDYQGAIEDYNKAIEINPNKAEAYVNRAFAKGELGDFRGAIEDCNKAIELNPKYAEAFYNRGFAKGELGYSKAYEAIRKYCH